MRKWNEMKYQFILIPITCTSILNDDTFEAEFNLSEISRRELSKFAEELRTSKKPALVVFASCFSYESSIKDFLFANGAMASLSITQDKGKVTEGKIFSLDEDQQSVIKEFVEVSHLFF